MKIKIILLIAGLSLMVSCKHEVNPFTSGAWIDLTHYFDEDAIYWPTAETFSFDTVFEGITEKGYYYSSFKFSAEEHGGTHMDAPRHFAEGKPSMHEIALERFIGPAVVVDVHDQALADRNYQLVIEDFLLWEQANGAMPDNAILLINTGYARFWPDREKYMGTAKTGPEGVAELQFPGLHPEAATWLIENRTVSLIGLDTPSIDYGKSTHFETHRILFEEEVLVVENVDKLDLLPPKGAWVLALPMKIRHGSGAPVRIVAWLPE
jgi:kynurenine formamidase